MCSPQRHGAAGADREVVGVHEVTKLAKKTTRAKGEVHKGVKSSGVEENTEDWTDSAGKRFITSELLPVSAQAKQLRGAEAGEPELPSFRLIL